MTQKEMLLKLLMEENDEDDIYEIDMDKRCSRRTLKKAQKYLQENKTVAATQDGFSEQQAKEIGTLMDCEDCVYSMECPYANDLVKMQADFFQDLAGTEIPREVSEVPLDIYKSKDSEQLVFGWASLAKLSDGTIPFDWDGDVKTPEAIEKAAYQHVLKYRKTGEEHIGEAVGDLVESVMFTKDKMAAMGLPEGTLPEGWWVGYHIPDEKVFAKVKNGEYKMFSIQGAGTREVIK